MQSPIAFPNSASGSRHSISPLQFPAPRGGAVCPFCEKPYASLESLWEHANSQHWKVEEFPCEICDTVYYDRPGRSKCQRRHRDKYRCNQRNCIYSALTPESVRKHLAETHSIPVAFAASQLLQKESGNPEAPNRRVQAEDGSGQPRMTKEELWKASCRTRLKLLGIEDDRPPIHWDTRPPSHISPAAPTSLDSMPDGTNQHTAVVPLPIRSASVPQRQAPPAEPEASHVPLPTYETISTLFSAVDQVLGSFPKETQVTSADDTTLFTSSDGRGTPPTGQAIPLYEHGALGSSISQSLRQLSPTVYSPSGYYSLESWAIGEGHDSGRSPSTAPNHSSIPLLHDQLRDGMPSMPPQGRGAAFIHWVPSGALLQLTGIPADVDPPTPASQISLNRAETCNPMSPGSLRYGGTGAVPLTKGSAESAPAQTPPHAITLEDLLNLFDSSPPSNTFETSDSFTSYLPNH